MDYDESLTFWENVARLWTPFWTTLILGAWPLQATVFVGILLNWLKVPLLLGWNLSWYGLGPWYLVEWFLVVPRWRAVRARLLL
jgi:hypothetical protein